MPIRTGRRSLSLLPQACVVAVNRGGVMAEVEGVRGFCPGSQLGFRVQSFEVRACFPVWVDERAVAYEARAGLG